MGSTVPKAQRQRNLTRASSWRNLIVPIYLLYGILVSTVLFAVPLRALSLGASEVLLGGIVSGFVSTGLLFSFIGAALCDRFGERSLLIGAFGCYALAYMAGVLAVSPFLLMLSAVTAGVGDMLFTVAGMTYLTHLVEHRGRDIIMSIAFSLLRAGSVVGRIGAGSIIESSGFEVVFLVGAFVSIAGLLLSAVLPKTSVEPRPIPVSLQGIFRPYKAAYDLLRRNETVRIVAAVTILGCMGWFTFRSSFYLDYLRRTGMSHGSIGLLTALGSVAMIVAPFVYSLLSRRGEALRAVAIGLVVAGVGLAATPLLSTAMLIGVVGIPAQMGDGFRLPGVYSLLSANTSSRDRPASWAIVNTSFAVAGLVAGLLWGLVVKAVGLSAAFYIAGLATVIGTFALYLVRGRSRTGATQDIGPTTGRCGEEKHVLSQ